MVEYKKIFLEKIKSLLFYIIEFEEDDKILSIKYQSDSAIKRPDRWSIIMIIHDESILFINDS